MGPYLTIIADILDLDPVNALTDGNLLMAGNLADRNPLAGAAVLLPDAAS